MNLRFHSDSLYHDSIQNDFGFKTASINRADFSVCSDVAMKCNKSVYKIMWIVILGNAMQRRANLGKMLTFMYA